MVMPADLKTFRKRKYVVFIKSFIKKFGKRGEGKWKR